MRDIEAGLHPDKTLIRIMIGEREEPGPRELASIDIDAGQLQSFMLNLAAMRAEMEPKVPMKLDPGRPIFKDSTASPRVMVGSTRLIAGEGVYVALRHAGHGWIAFSFTPAEARDLMQLLAQTILKVQPKAIDRRIILP